MLIWRRISLLAFSALFGLALAFVWLRYVEAAPATPAATIHCVNSTGTGCLGSCGACYSNVQAALDTAANYEEIRIANVHFTGTPALARIRKPVTIIGGYSPDLSTFDPGLYETILDANNLATVISATNVTTLTLRHLTVQHGLGSGNCVTYGCGGGLYVRYSNLILSHCKIQYNLGSSSGSAGNGGGVYVYNTTSYSAEILFSRIYSNTASSGVTMSGNGGGIYVRGGRANLEQNEISENLGSQQYGGTGGVDLINVGSATILSNTIISNTGTIADYWSVGGGIDVYTSDDVLIRGNTIQNNNASLDAAGYGGGVNVEESEVSLERNIIIGNNVGTVAGHGGGIAISSYKPVTLTNNLIAHNGEDYPAGGVFIDSYDKPSLVSFFNNTIADNDQFGITVESSATITGTNNLIIGHQIGITQTVTTGVQFNLLNNLFWNTNDPITGTYSIRQSPMLLMGYLQGQGSPAIDHGRTIPWLIVDLQGNHRPQGAAYDIGAFEGIFGNLLYLPLIRK